VGRKSLEFQLNLLFAGRSDGPPDAGSVFSFVRAETVEVMYQRHWVDDGSVAIRDKDHPLAEQEVQVAPRDGRGVGEGRDLVRCDRYEYELSEKLSWAVVEYLLDRISGFHYAASE